MALTLDGLVKDHYEIVHKETPSGTLYIKVKRTDPRMAARVPWLIAEVLRQASPKVNPEADPYAAIEAEAAQGGKTRQEVENERLTQMYALAREVVTHFGTIEEPDESEGSAGAVGEIVWREVVLEDSEDKRKDVPDGPLHIEVSYLDPLTLMAICHAAVSRLEAVTQRIAPFLRARLRSDGLHVGSDGQGVR